MVEQPDLWPQLGPTFCKHSRDDHSFISWHLRPRVLFYNQFTAAVRPNDKRVK